MILDHILSIALLQGVKVDKKTIRQKARKWLETPDDPDRQKIEQLDPGAFKCTGDGWLAWKALTQPRIKGVFADTSLSPKPQHRKKQPVVLESWRKFGLRIVAVNTSAEVEAMRAVYPQVNEWVKCDENDGFYSKPTQRVNTLLNQAVVSGEAALLINSDIEIYGDQERFKELIEQRQNAVGIRRNYTVSPAGSRLEPYGLDAMLVFPEAARMVDETPYSIGRPFWDYWLTWMLMKNGTQLAWIGEKLFFHELHAIHWTSAEWMQGSKWFDERYVSGIHWEKWRLSLPFPPAPKPRWNEPRTQED